MVSFPSLNLLLMSRRLSHGVSRVGGQSDRPQTLRDHLSHLGRLYRPELGKTTMRWTLSMCVLFPWGSRFPIPSTSYLLSYTLLSSPLRSHRKRYSCFVHQSSGEVTRGQLYKYSECFLSRNLRRGARVGITGQSQPVSLLTLLRSIHSSTNEKWLEGIEWRNKGSGFLGQDSCLHHAITFSQ